MYRLFKFDGASIYTKTVAALQGQRLQREIDLLSAKDRRSMQVISALVFVTLVCPTILFV